MLFFGQKKRLVRIWRIVLDQYLGFTALVAISLIGYFARYVAPAEWIGLLGFPPVAIGVKKLLERKKARDGMSNDEAVGINATSSVYTVAAVTFANGADNIGIYTAPYIATNSFVAPWCPHPQQEEIRWLRRLSIVMLFEPMNWVGGRAR